MLGTRILRAAVLAALSVCAVSFAVHAGAAETQKTVNVQAGDLTDALEALARQYGVNVIYTSSELRGLKTQGVSGSMTPREAVLKLLEGTALRVSTDEASGAMMISRADVPARSSAAADQGGGIHLARSDQGESPKTVEENSAEDSAGAAEKGIPEILVKGARTLNMDIQRSRDSSQPYVIFDRGAIEKSGARSIEDFLRDRLTSMSSPSTLAQQEGGSNTSRFDLRGLGVGQTLILLDGHRMASRNSAGSTAQSDLNGIPLASVERIEVLPMTASGIYGGGATGGVINIVRRRDYSGAEARLNYENTTEGGGMGRRIDLGAGFNFAGGKTNVMLVGGYYDADPLLVRERDFLQRGRALSMANNPAGILNASIPLLGGTTNIRSLGGVPLTLKAAYGGGAIGAANTYIPYSYAGPASDNGARLIQNAGRYNLDAADTMQFGGGGRQALLNSPTVKSLSATIRSEFTPWLQGFLDMSGSKNEGSFASNRVSGMFFLPGAALGNPFNQNIFVVTPAFGADQMNTEDYGDRRAVAGLIFKLPMNWQAEADYTWHRTRYNQVSASGVLNGDAGAAVTSGAIDLFRDTNAYPVDFSPYLTRPTVYSPTKLTLKDTAVRFSGPLGWALPGGMPTMTVLFEHRDNAIGEYRITNADFDDLTYPREQRIDSVYAEAQVPLVSRLNAMPGIEALELDLKVRRDWYEQTTSNVTSFLAPAPEVRTSSKSSSTDPTFGIRYQPLRDVTFRASYGTGFMPPDLGVIGPPDPPFTRDWSFLEITDPRRGNEIAGTFAVTGGGNPNLRPEQSESRSAGVILTPRFIEGLRVSADWVRIDKRDNISSFGLDQTSFDNELLIPGLIERGPASDGFEVGPVTVLNSGYFNIARQQVEAYDFALDYAIDTRPGTFTFSSAATHNIKNVTQVLSTLPAFDRVGLNGSARWVANASLTWEYGVWAATWASHWYDGYCLNSGCAAGPNTLSQGALSIPSQIYHDLSASYSFGDTQATSLLSGLTAQFGVRNVFNTRPPILAATQYYSTQGDPRLATYFLTLRKTFGNR